MIITNKLLKELISLEENIHAISTRTSINDTQMETFLRNLEKRRYNILSEIKLYNKTMEDKSKKIYNISNDYRVYKNENCLNIYIPEAMPSYRNLKTHTYKNILLNIAEKTKQYSNMFEDKVIVLITIYDNIKGWDVDNKFIKPIFDALICSGVIEDDNIDKMFYMVKGECSNTPHTEVSITTAKKSIDIIEKYIS